MTVTDTGLKSLSFFFCPPQWKRKHFQITRAPQVSGRISLLKFLNSRENLFFFFEAFKIPGRGKMFLRESKPKSDFSFAILEVRRLRNNVITKQICKVRTVIVPSLQLRKQRLSKFFKVAHLVNNLQFRLTLSDSRIPSFSYDALLSKMEENKTCYTCEVLLPKLTSEQKF